MSDKLKIQQHEMLHNDPEAGKLFHEDDQYWNYFPASKAAGDMTEGIHEIYDASPSP